MIRLIILFGLLPLCAASAQRETGVNRLTVIPTPQLSAVKSGNFKINSQTRIILGSGAAKDDSFTADELNVSLEEIKQISIKISHEKAIRRLFSNYIFLGSPKSGMGAEFLKTRGGKLSPVMKAEGYFLDVNEEGIVIIAESIRGRYYGIMTLIQMITKQRVSLLVPCVTIHDWPSLRFRGISDDISRGQISTLNNFKKIIRFLSRHKLNVYSPYIEDVFAFKSHPLIGKGRGALTAAEVKELDEFARQHHVELIPIFETLGHWENMLVIPEYVRYAEFPGAHTLNVSDQSIYPLLDQMIGELAQAFSSPYFNMAADESWDVGLGASKARVNASDIATVHAEHYKRLFTILKKYKKRPLMYGDILLNEPTILEKIPKDVIIVDWHYYATDKYASPSLFKKAGFSFIVSPAIWNFTGPFPNYINTFLNIQQLTRDGYHNGTLGLLTSNWNDYGGEAFRELNYYGYAWSAECAWEPLSSDHVSFSETFFSRFFGNPKAGKTAQTIYALLSEPYNQLNWHELWRHPMLPLYETPMKLLWRVQSIESSMPLVTRHIEELRILATLNKEHIDYLEFIVNINKWFAKKLLAGEYIKRISQDTSGQMKREAVISDIIEKGGAIINDLQKLKTEFKNLWFTTNRESGLNLLIARYDRQIAYWQEKIDEVSRGELWVNPLIESNWICHPDAHLTQKNLDALPAPKVYFTKEVQLEHMPHRATLQLMGDTHAKLFINGVEIGEVFARRSLSLFVEHQRVKVFDILRNLKVGQNIIAVETANYNKGGSAGVNIYAELFFPDGSKHKLMTDTSWNTSTLVNPGWKEKEAAGDWVRASVKSFKGEVIRPNFSTQRYSWIER